MMRLWLLLFLLSMTLLIIEGYSDKTHKYELQDRCKFLKETKVRMYQKCKGKFPLVAYMKYKDTFMKQDDRMALYMPESLEYVMVTLKDSDLHRCESFQLIGLREYLCYDADGGRKTIRFQDVRMYCFPFHIQITDDLMHECVFERDGDDYSKLEADTLRTKAGIIQYIFDNNSTERLMPLQQVFIVFVAIVALGI